MSFDTLTVGVGKTTILTTNSGPGHLLNAILMDGSGTVSNAASGFAYDQGQSALGVLSSGAGGFNIADKSTAPGAAGVNITTALGPISLRPVVGSFYSQPGYVATDSTGHGTLVWSPASSLGPTPQPLSIALHDTNNSAALGTFTFWASASNNMIILEMAPQSTSIALSAVGSQITSGPGALPNAYTPNQPQNIPFNYEISTSNVLYSGNILIQGDGSITFQSTQGGTGGANSPGFNYVGGVIDFIGSSVTYWQPPLP